VALGHQAIGLLRQRDQQVECAATERRGLAIDEQPALARLQLEAARRAETNRR